MIGCFLSPGRSRDMASSPVVEGGVEAHVAVAKNVAFREGSTVRRPRRLRVLQPDMVEFLRSPRGRVRARKPAPLMPSPRAAGGGREERERERYGCAFEDEEEEEGKSGFAPPRLVWAKLALRQQRGRRAVLVAYFWDKTFSWVDPVALRPFRGTFPRLAAQSAKSPFVAAVDAALGEVARRVDAGLSCRCAATAAKKQVIDNTGVREGARGAAVDAAFARGALRGEAFVGYVFALATAPLAGADRVDLTVATAQLKAFSRWRGSRGHPEYNFFHGINGLGMEAAPARAKRRRSRTQGDADAYEKWKMSRCKGRGNAASESVDDALALEDLEVPPQPTPQQMPTKMGMLMSRAAQQISRSPVILRANDGSPSANNGGLKDDHTCKVPLVGERRPAEETENPLQARLVLKFSDASVVPSTSELTMIFSRFGPIEEVRAVDSIAMVIFKRREHAEEAFSGTAKISTVCALLSSSRLTALPAAPRRMMSAKEKDPLTVEPVQ
ncbi:hypothetical protein ACP70R_034886 [Stipagrostis hirtigluma subsp. patula]